MKLSETNFQVVFNKKFIEILDIEKEQIAWLVREAADLMSVDSWELNEIAYSSNEDLDCWQQNVILKDGSNIVLEGVPYPKDFLMLWTPNHPETLPKLNDPNTTYMNFPSDFNDLLIKDRIDLKVFKIEEIK
jgi:hypothetical protein